MVYRNQNDADLARITGLQEELAATKRALAEMREELIEVRRKHARAQNVLSMIAHTRKVQLALEDSATGPDELVEMMASPSNRPPPPTKGLERPSGPPSPRAAAGSRSPAAETPQRPRRSSAGRYMLVVETDDTPRPDDD